MSRLTPQEKKKLSYERDHRNTYGGNDKASRRSIPFRKRLVNSTNRHQDNQILMGANGEPDEELETSVADRLHGRRRERWRKMPDRELGLVVLAKIQHRQWLEEGTSDSDVGRECDQIEASAADG